MNICIYDATEASAVGLSWKIGARLYKAIGRFDAIHGATSWADAWEWLENETRGRHIDSLQFWGHGSPGSIYIDGADLWTGPAHSAAKAWLRFKSDGLFWLRTCGTAAGNEGHDFMMSMASVVHCKVAAHTHVIGLWHSGLQTLMPGETPTWSTDATRRLSSPTESHTIPFWANSFPKEW